MIKKKKRNTWKFHAKKEWEFMSSFRHFDWPRFTVGFSVEMIKLLAQIQVFRTEGLMASSPRNFWNIQRLIFLKMVVTWLWTFKNCGNDSVSLIFYKCLTLVVLISVVWSNPQNLPRSTPGLFILLSHLLNLL